MDNNTFYYHPQAPAYDYNLGLPSGDAASYSPTTPPPPMSRGGSNESYHSSSSSSTQYPEVRANPMPEEMSYHDNNAVYSEYSQFYPSGGVKREDDEWQTTFSPDESHVYYEFAASEPVPPNYTTSPASAMPLSPCPLEDTIPRTEPMSPVGQPEGHTCLFPQCDSKPFKRKADLDRHWEHVHLPPDQKATYFCDYSKCSRHEEPFNRLDHCRDHLREYHKEDLVRKNGKEDDEWYRNRKVSSKWFRCTKCLRRNQIRDSGWACLHCNSACDKKRQTLRAR
ncbi:uncharacterized protein PG998_013923 [Apiospora kogelbergensis]|uniref:uncharacterized protein n=1 Tax=Apiospora kogelbergensis TaxID=1337665 RepID=UPI0031312240